MPHHVLIVEDEQSIREALAELFDVPGTVTTTAATLDAAQLALHRTPFDFIVTDLRLGVREEGGLHVLAVAGMLAPMATIVVITAYPHGDNRAASVRLGATYFLEKPADLRAIAELAAERGIATAMHPAAASSPAAVALAP